MSKILLLTNGYEADRASASIFLEYIQKIYRSDVIVVCEISYDFEIIMMMLLVLLAASLILFNSS